MGKSRNADSVFDAFNPLTTVRLFQRLPVAYAQVLLALLTLAVDVVVRRRKRARTV